MSVQGVINRIRRQVGLPTVPPNIAADELQFDPVAGVFYFMPDEGGVAQIVQQRALSGILNGGWEEEGNLEWNAGPRNTVPGVITLGRVGVGEYYLATDAPTFMTSLIQGFDYQKVKPVFFDGFYNRVCVLEFRVQAPVGSPGGSVGISIRRTDTGVKQDFNGAVQIYVPY